MMATTAGSADAVPDIYGQVHPVETPELIRAKLAEFATTVDALANRNVIEAHSIGKSPGTRHSWLNDSNNSNDDFNLLFLRCDTFHVDLAAARYAAYWDKRVQVFGPKRAFEPLLRLETFPAEDRAALESGFVRVVEVDKTKDNEDSSTNNNNKRNYLFLDPSKRDRSKYSRESLVRAIWYMIHALLQGDEAVQTKGAVFVAFPHHATFAQFDRTLVKMILGSIQGCWPVRLSAMHLCHPPPFFRIVFPIVQMFMNKRLKKRIHVHAGSEQHVLEQLEKYNLSASDLPTDLGGNKALDVKTWLDEREKAGK